VKGFFDGQGLFSEPVPFDGRSDYVAFTDVGIPAGGIDQMADAAAHAVITLAQSTSAVNGARGRGNFNTTRQIDAAAAK
jgi:hypothetical protein